MWPLTSSANRQADRSLLVFGRFLGDVCDVNERCKGDGSAAIVAYQGQTRRDGRIREGVLLRKREVAANLTFNRKLAQGFNEEVADWARVVISIDMRLRRYVANFPTPKEAGKVPLPSSRGQESGCIKRK